MAPFDRTPNFQQLMQQAVGLTRAGRLREAGAALRRALAGDTAAQGSARTRSTEDVIDIHARTVERPVPDRSVADTPPSEGRVVSGSFGNDAGRRAYRLFVPGGAASTLRPLLVMLHGCKQNPDDFAAGTRMNELAQAQGWLVLYPEQPKTANGFGCWNWFQAGDQRRDRGEPSILADLTRHIADTQPVDSRRVYVAGLSAGGAMAATLAATYPDIFAAVGVHSGLAHRAAHDVSTAFQAMRQGAAGSAGTPSEAPGAVPTIVFHGDRDETVNPLNGAQVIEGARSAATDRDGDGTSALRAHVERGRVPGGHAYTRTLHVTPDGRIQTEHWVVHGAGHAWSGGSSAGSYTDSAGPDASTEMLRFFAAHRGPSSPPPAPGAEGRPLSG